MKNILITGIRGFIGFNAIQLWKKQHPECNFVGLDAETYADQFMMQQKNKWLYDNNVPFYTIILGEQLYGYDNLKMVVERHSIDTIVHYSSESHVDNSIKNPNVFFQSNVMGIVDVLNVAKDYGIRVHVVSTDEVYGETTPEDWIIDGKQIDANGKKLVPSSPYSSSKASADLIALSYHRTFGVNVTISRCTNNAGAWQMAEKLIPTVIMKAMHDEKIPVYGEGNQRRHWIHVDDHNKAIFKILEEGKIGNIYNIGPIFENWTTNIELIKFILQYMNKPESLIHHIVDRPGHDTSYFLTPSLGEFETESYKQFMPRTIDWYLANLQI